MSRKQAIFVLGMHRSGTSTVSNFITSLGYDLGHHPMAPREDNPKGFWENTEITRVNDEILALHGLRWDSLTLIQDLPIESICHDKQIRSKVLQVLEEEFDTDNISIKDPRMCHLLPLWKSVLNEANYETHYVTVNRDPTAVAKSLAKRDMMSFERGLLLWLLYSISLARHIAASSTIAIDYDKLMKSPVASLAPLKPLNPDVFSEQVPKFVDEFLADSLYHHSPTGTTNSLARYALSIKQTLDKSESSKGLKNINVQLDALLQMYSYKEVNDLPAPLYDELSETKAHAAKLEGERQRNDDYVLDLSRQIDEQTEFSDSLKDETLTLNSHIKEKDTYLKSMEFSVSEMQAALQEKDEYVTGMQTALQEKDEYANSLTQTLESASNDNDKLREALSEKSFINDEHIISLHSKLSKRDNSIAKLNADLVESQKHLGKLEGNTLVKIFARIAGIKRLTNNDE
jgi:uncharacterized coiled-coil protein SlyX